MRSRRLADVGEYTSAYDIWVGAEVSSSSTVIPGDLTSYITRVPGRFATPEHAWRCTDEYVAAADVVVAPIEDDRHLRGPTVGGTGESRLQTLHFDFGVPLVPFVAVDVARLTRPLHVPASASSAQALTRFVPLRPLLSGHAWPSLEELVRRLVAYGASNGAWQPATGYAEGSLARVIEAALGQPPALPSVSANPDFLYGTEFSNIDDETLFFAQRGLSIDAVAVEVRLQPGELLLFENLAVAHGRRGKAARQANCTKECSGTGHSTLASRSNSGTACLPPSPAEARPRPAEESHRGHVEQHARGHEDRVLVPAGIRMR